MDEYGIFLTPKAHILFEQTCDHERAPDGLANKCKNWIELSHQDGLQLDHLTARIPKKYKSKTVNSVSNYFEKN